VACEMGFRGQFAPHHTRAAHVRFGSKADIGSASVDIRFTPKSGHQAFMTTRLKSRAKKRAEIPSAAASALVSQGLLQVGNSSGTTAQRPTGSGALFPGWIHIDTTLSAVVVFDGTNWRNPITGAIT
jgi:hypothetical protein